MDTAGSGPAATHSERVHHVLSTGVEQANGSTVSQYTPQCGHSRLLSRLLSSGWYRWAQQTKKAQKPNKKCLWVQATHTQKGAHHGLVAGHHLRKLGPFVMGCCDGFKGLGHVRGACIGHSRPKAQKQKKVPLVQPLALRQGPSCSCCQSPSFCRQDLFKEMVKGCVHYAFTGYELPTFLWAHHHLARQRGAVEAATSRSSI